MILVVVVVLVLFISIKLIKDLSATDQPAVKLPTMPSVVDKAVFSLGIPSDNTSVSLASRMDIAVEKPHSLEDADFSGGMNPVKDRVTEAVREPIKEPFKTPAQEIFPVIDMKLKYEKLEQMLSEKNKELEGLKKDLENERLTHGEFEILRKTFQEQIEELKVQNRKSKTDLQAIIQENAELKSSLAKRPEPVVEEYIRAEVDTTSDIILEAPEEREIPLRDIFNQNNIKKEGDV